MKTENTTQKAINYLSIYADKSKDFNSYKYIERSKSNPLQVSYIKQEKIDSLLEYTGLKIKGTAEQRKKYFVNTSITKLLSSMFVDNQRIEQIGTDIDRQFRKDFTANADFFITDDVKGFYSRENKEFIYNNNGSCMEGKPSNFFEIYKNFKNVNTQIVGLKVGQSVVARAMLWTKTTRKEVITAVSLDDKKAEKRLKEKNLLGTISTWKEETQYFLDRIYIGNAFKNSNEEEIQLKLHSLVKRMLRVKTLDCYSAYHINRHIEDKTSKAKKVGASEPSFSIQIDADTFQELECYPYADTFRYGKELSNNVKFSDEEDAAEYVLDNTDGYYTEGNGNFCECCEDRVDEDYGSYSEVEQEYLCEDCSIYLEDREDVCRESNTIYDSYREVHCYDGDF